MTTYTTTVERASAGRRENDVLDDPEDGRTANLDQLIGFNELPVLVTVHRDGRVTVETDRADAPSSPDLDADTDPDPYRQARRYGWELVTGFTGRHGHNGPCMHASEYIGGDLARRVLTYGADVWGGENWHTLHAYVGKPGEVCVYAPDEDQPDEPCGWPESDHDPDSIATWWTAVVVSESDGESESWALAYRAAS